MTASSYLDSVRGVWIASRGACRYSALGTLHNTQHLIARFGRYETPPCPSLSVLTEIGPESIQRFANIPKADGEGRSFDMLVRVEKDRAVTEVLLYPPTKVGQRLPEPMLKDTFSPLPTPAHWVFFFPPGATRLFCCLLFSCTSPRDRSAINSPRQFSVPFPRVAWLRTDSNANRPGFRRLLKRSRRVRLRFG